MLPEHLNMVRQFFTIVLIAFFLVLASDLPGAVAPSKSVKPISKVQPRSALPGAKRSSNAVRANAVNSGGKRAAFQIKLPVEWFRKFDQIRRNAEPTEQEKRDGNLLLLRALSGGGSVPDNQELTRMLLLTQRRYQIAASEVSRLPKLNSELESLRNGYGAYYSAAAELCSLCRDTTSSDAINRERVRALVEQKGLITDLGIEFDRADALIRSKYGVAQYDAEARPGSGFIASKKRPRI